MKKFISIVLLLIILLGQFGMVGMADEDEDLRNKLMPIFSIENTSIPSGNAGSPMTLSFNLINTGYQAKNIVITPEFIAENNPFTVSSFTQSTTIPKINGNSTTKITMNFSISGDAIPGNYPIKLNFNYKNAYDYEGNYSETIYVKVVSKSTQPKIMIKDVITEPKEIGPGDAAKLVMLLDNKGSLEARDISVTLEGLKPNEGFYMEKGSNVKHVNRIAGNSVGAISFDLKTANNIKRGSHELAVKLSYKGSQKNIIEDSQNIYLNIKGKAGNSSNISIENLAYPSTSIRPGNDFVLSFDLVNTGQLEASNIIVKIESSDTAIVPKTPSIQKVNLLESESSKKMNFVFSPTKDAESRNYPINITIEYEDELNQDSENKYLLTQYIGINVDNPSNDEEDTKGKPKLIIDKYTFEPSLAKAGENFTMNLSFFNTNKEKSVENIKIFLTSDEKSDPNSPSAGGNIFTPVNSSNTFYIDSIPPKGRVEKSIVLSTVSDALAKTYTITANFEYEDSNGEEYTAIELIGIPVIQQSKLEVGELLVPPEAYAWEPTPISVEFYNTGKVTLYNMMVKLEGDFPTENATYYVGNFESGSTDYFEGLIIPEEPGELKGAIVFTYEDSTGEIVEYREEFTLNVMKPMPMDEFPEEMPPMDEPRGIKKLLKSKGFWITIILISAAIGGFVFYKKKKKKGMALDE